MFWHVADLVRPLAHLQERVVAGRARVGRIEQQAMGEAATPAGRELPVLALDVVHDGRAGPGEQRRDDQADALAGARRCEGHHMLGTVVAEIPVAEPPEEDARGMEQPGPLDLLPARPARRAVGGDEPVLPGAPQRADDGDDDARKSARRCDHAGLVEDRRRIGVVGVPPLEEAPGVIDRPGEDREPGQAEPRLVGELGRGPLGRHPQAADHHREDDQDLAEEELGGGHPPSHAWRELRVPSLRQESLQRPKMKIAFICAVLRSLARASRRSQFVARHRMHGDSSRDRKTGVRFQVVRY